MGNKWDEYYESERRDFWADMYKLAYGINQDMTLSMSIADDALAIFDSKFAAAASRQEEE